LKLSPNFGLAEFVSPKDPEGHRAPIETLKALAEALESLRAALGRPLVITSGYRSPEYNRLIGGASGSQHTAGTAADISIGDLKAQLKAVAEASKIPAIGGIGLYPSRGFIHVDIRRRIGGKPTLWEQLADGSYIQPAPSIKQAIRRLGGNV